MRAKRPSSGDPAVERNTRSERVGRTPRPTMVDVANEAGKVQTTVSLVLNQSDGAVLSAETRERVIKAAAKLGYQPIRRGGARRLFAPRRSRSSVTRFPRIPGPRLLRRRARKSMGAWAYRHGCMATRGDAEIESAVMAQLASQPLLGLIYATINTRLIHAPAATLPQVPLVLLNCHVSGGRTPHWSCPPRWRADTAH